MTQTSMGINTTLFLPWVLGFDPNLLWNSWFPPIIPNSIKKNSLPFWIVCHPLFCKLSTASFLNKKIETQYVQTPIINYMKPAPSTCRHCVRWNAPPPSGPVASVLSAGHRKWLGRGKHYPKVDLEQKTTRTPTVQQHTGLEVLEVTFLEDTPPPCPCPVVSL